MRLRRSLIAAAIGIALATPAGAGDKLTGDQLKAAYSGARIYANTVTGRVVQHDYNRDGTVTGIVGTKGKSKDLDSGTWWVKGDTLCRKWNKWSRDKPEACFAVEQAGGKAIWYRADGSVYREWRVAPKATEDMSEAPPCRDVGGYEAYMKKTGKVCRLQ